MDEMDREQSLQRIACALHVTSDVAKREFDGWSDKNLWLYAETATILSEKREPEYA